MPSRSRFPSHSRRIIFGLAGLLSGGLVAGATASSMALDPGVSAAVQQTVGTPLAPVSDLFPLREATVSASDAVRVPSIDELPAHLPAGDYEFAFRALPPEIADSHTGEALTHALLSDPRTFRVVIEGDGSFDAIETSAKDASERMHFRFANGINEVWRGEVLLRRAKEAPKGPISEFSSVTLGALLQREQAEREQARERGLQAGTQVEPVWCPESVACVHVVSKHGVEVGDYYDEGETPSDFLPFHTDGNDETADIVYDPGTKLVYLVRTAVNGLPTYEFRITRVQFR